MNGNNQPAVAASSQKQQGCQRQLKQRALTATSMSMATFKQSIAGATGTQFQSRGDDRQRQQQQSLAIYHRKQLGGTIMASQ